MNICNKIRASHKTLLPVSGKSRFRLTSKFFPELGAVGPYFTAVVALAAGLRNVRR